MQIIETIASFVDELNLIDTHEHIAASDGRGMVYPDIIAAYTAGSFGDVLVSSGLSEQLLAQLASPDISVSRKWQIASKYWEFCRFTGAGRAIDIAAEDLYGARGGVNASNINDLNTAFIRCNRSGWYRHVLTERSGIGSMIIDGDPECDNSYTFEAFRLDDYVLPETTQVLQDIERETGVVVTNFDDWLDACEKAFAIAASRGAVALKTALAYRRSLRFERVSRVQAEEAFNRAFTNAGLREQPLVIAKEFQDYMMHFIMWRANESGMPVQLHTGWQTGNGNYIDNSRPEHLANLFMTYPGIRFDLLHMSYPWFRTAGALAHSFPNVYLDMAGLHSENPSAAREALAEWLNVVPLNKINAFGGDADCVDLVYSAQLMARDNVSAVLSECVNDGVMSLQDACAVAKLILCDNPAVTFRL